MSHLHRRLGAVAAAVLSTTAIALPALAEDPGGFEPADLPATVPATPHPKPGATNIPSPGSATEDDMPATDAERQSALSQLSSVAACVRDQGLDIPNPTSDADGVHVSWSGGIRPDVERAIARCDTAITVGPIASAPATRAAPGGPPAAALFATLTGVGWHHGDLRHGGDRAPDAYDPAPPLDAVHERRQRHRVRGGRWISRGGPAVGRCSANRSRRSSWLTSSPPSPPRSSCGCPAAAPPA